MKRIYSRGYLIATAVCLLVIISFLFVYFFANLSNTGKVEYLYIDKDDNIDSVYNKLERISDKESLKGFKTLARHLDYEENILTGRYKILPDEGSITVLKHLKSGSQEPVSLTIPSARTIEELSSKLSKKLMFDSMEIAKLLKSQDICMKFGQDTCTIISIFIPNTYDVYWNTTAEALLKRMQKECNAFWNKGRTGKAESLGLSKKEVMVLASIIDEETANDKEKPTIARMYYNRLKQNMPLQADPTVKFALKIFGARRIYEKMLFTDSPYNTYKYEGLPPGPIRIPSIAAIEAVLNMESHDYIYMCAKEDFSGTHNFASTYEEHLKNAKRYTEALNKRGIR